MNNVQRRVIAIGFILLLLIGVTVMVASVVVPLVAIHFRLSRNGAIAKQLAESMEAQFPGVEIRAAAAYNREEVYVIIVSESNERKRAEFERWLRNQKVEREIAPQIRLRFQGDEDNGKLIE